MSLTCGQAALVGAIIGDAASMGAHWLYSAEKLAEIRTQRPLEFLDPVYNDGHYAHKGKVPGQLTHYGSHFRCAVQAMESSSTLDAQIFGQKVTKAFGYGGWYCGYVDGVLKNVLQKDAASEPLKGIDDGQVAAFAKIPPLVVAQLNHADLMSQVERAIRMTNENEDAVQYGKYAAKVLQLALQSKPLEESLHAALTVVSCATATATIKKSLSENLQTLATGEALAKCFGNACGITQAIPLSLAILRQSKTYTSAMQLNIAAGGDSSGRAIFIGSVLGAIHGVGTPSGVPQSWIDRTLEHETLVDEIKKISTK